MNKLFQGAIKFYEEDFQFNIVSQQAGIFVRP